MDISARNAAGECHSGANWRVEKPITVLAALLAAGFWSSAHAQSAMPERTVIASRTPSTVPLPRPRPSLPGEANTAPDSAPEEKTAPAASAQPPPPSACRLALTDAVAIAPSIPPVNGPGACGGDDLVRLEAVVLPDKRRVAVKPAATVRCRMATAIADWVRTDMVPLAAGLGTTVSELDNFDSFSCRGRNRVAGAKLSEHGRANALDVRAVKLANGTSLSLTDRNAPRDLREKVMASVCARFTTVLGPGSDGYHEDHIHLDLAERRNGYRICQWMIQDKEMQVATPLPSPRPQEAPSRELASRDDAQPTQDVDTRQVEDVKVQPAPPPPALSLSPVPLARQPADVAKPLASKPSTSRKVGSKPDASVSETAKPADTPSRNARRAAREATPPPMPIVPDAKPANDAKPSAANSGAKSAAKSARRRTARAKVRRSEPDLPRVLRRMFE